MSKWSVKQFNTLALTLTTVFAAQLPVKGGIGALVRFPSNFSYICIFSSAMYLYCHACHFTAMFSPLYPTAEKIKKKKKKKRGT
jgi:hypothetical protein